MLGAILGDMAGAPYEGRQAPATANFPLLGPKSRFTDDTVLTVATTAVFGGEHAGDYVHAYTTWAWQYPHAGYGGNFWNWVKSWDREPYGSFGNGAAMRVSPIGWLFETLDATLAEARNSAAVSHNHPEGILAAQVIAGGIFLARTGSTRTAIGDWAEAFTGWELSLELDVAPQRYTGSVRAGESVPLALIAFLRGEGAADVVRKAILLGGDSDTIACMAGSLAEAADGGLPADLVKAVSARLDDRLRNTARAFIRRCPPLAERYDHF